jgi:hypothetical protein
LSISPVISPEPSICLTISRFWDRHSRPDNQDNLSCQVRSSTSCDHAAHARRSDQVARALGQANLRRGTFQGIEVHHRPMTWLLSRFCPKGESSLEFIGETGRAGLTTLKRPLMSDRSTTEEWCCFGSKELFADCRTRYSEKVRIRMLYLCRRYGIPRILLSPLI